MARLPVLAVASTEFALSGALIERSPAHLRKYNHCGGSLKIAAIEDSPVIAERTKIRSRKFRHLAQR